MNPARPALASHADAGPLPSAAASRGRAAAARRRARQQEIVASTRELFDARGMRAANIDDIAKAVGINRAIIYRHFASKDELFALALADYLVELDGLLSAADDPGAVPRERLGSVTREFATYCLRYPAFVDCALALLGRPGPELLDDLSESALLRLGTLMAAQLRRISDILRRGATVTPTVDADADVLANALYLQVLGVMHLARSGVVLRPAPGTELSWATVGQDRIVDLVTGMVLAVAFPAQPPGSDARGAS
jgi:AcrR family transcriptional regulator